jgi:hypothetical protein
MSKPRRGITGTSKHNKNSSGERTSITYIGTGPFPVPVLSSVLHEHQSLQVSHLRCDPFALNRGNTGDER